MRTSLIGLAILVATVTCVVAEDWRMGGRSGNRNPVSPEKNAPLDWQLPENGKGGKNIHWAARLQNRAIGGPVVADGLVWVGTNNRRPRDPAAPGDRGVLACFREADGEFLYQYTSPRLPPSAGSERTDWPTGPLSGSPVTEENRIWFITNRREVVWLDTNPLRTGQGPARELWKVDLIAQLGVIPSSPMMTDFDNLGSCAIHRDWLYVPTGNSAKLKSEGLHSATNPKAPSLVCLNKRTGEIVWQDYSDRHGMYHGAHSSPLVIEAAASVQVVHAQADGWVRGFDTGTGELLWSFDTNHKNDPWTFGRSGRRKRVVIATPVHTDGLVYFGHGDLTEFSSGPGRIFCINPAGKRGDISAELQDEQGQVRPNPNSGLVWDFARAGDAKSDQMHLCGSSVAIESGLLIAADHEGFVHCFDARTGQRHWVFNSDLELRGNILIVDGKVYLPSVDGEVLVLELARTFKVLLRPSMINSIESPIVYANGTLYVLTIEGLYAIAEMPE
jgi:outer membrane protein assembly factor BamB